MSPPDDPLLAAIRELRKQFEALHAARDKELRDLHDLLASMLIRVADMESRMDGLATALLTRNRGQS